MWTARIFIALPLMLVAAWLGYQFGDRTLPVRSEILSVETPEVEQGGVLLTRTGVSREDRCPAVVNEFLFTEGSNVRWRLDSQTYPTSPGKMGEETFISQTSIPLTFPVGPARMRRVITFVCNFTQTWNPLVETLPDVRFSVVAAKSLVGPKGDKGAKGERGAPGEPE